MSHGSGFQETRWLLSHYLFKPPLFRCDVEARRAPGVDPFTWVGGRFWIKMNFYLSAVDDLLCHPDDKPSIGLILCKTKNRIIAEYALRNATTPMGVSELL
jgi:YhcG PDDEXK nuclease domain